MVDGGLVGTIAVVVLMIIGLLFLIYAVQWFRNLFSSCLGMFFSPTGWAVALFLAALFGLAGIVDLFVQGTILSIPGIGIGAIIIYCLFQPRVKAYFGMPSAFQPLHRAKK